MPQSGSLGGTIPPHLVDHSASLWLLAAAVRRFDVVDGDADLRTRAAPEHSERLLGAKRSRHYEGPQYDRQRCENASNAETFHDPSPAPSIRRRRPSESW